MDARYSEKTDEGKIRCLLCPHACIIAEGRHGLCRVRTNEGGRMALPFAGKLSALAMDPVEKKPFFHFFPGRMVLSAGFWGCNLHCPYCQNYQISQRTDPDSRYFSPENLVRAAIDQGSFGIAYTYSEPLVHQEYVLETAKLAQKNGLKNCLVSNGFICADPADELLEWIDAANIDLKSFNGDFYRKELGGGLEEVKRFLERAAGRIHLEVTTLIIPGRNDTAEEMEELSGFLADLDPDLPYHLSCYRPMYKYTLPPTPVETVLRLGEISRKKLRFVYAGNIGLAETNTDCPNCGKVLIRRRGYSTRTDGIRNGACAHCGAALPFLVLPESSS